MDIATYLQRFKNSMSSYTGDDPLDSWDKFVDYLERMLPADGSSGMSQVFDSLVQGFLNVERYANDIRYVNYCIKCASYYSDPIALYSYIYSKGVGTRTAALYVAWAQQFEQRGMNEQAEATYQKAMENQAQPADTVLNEYKQFQSRTRSQTAVSAGGRNPLQNSNLTNQMSSHREPAAQNSADCGQPPTRKTVFTLSRSETSGTISSSQSSGAQTVSAYMKDELICEGSELCFEEVRAEKYFRKLREKPEKEPKETILFEAEKMLRDHEDDLLNFKCLLERMNQDLGAFGGLSSQPSSQRDDPFQPSSSETCAPLENYRPAENYGPAEHNTTHQEVCFPPEPEEKLNMSQGGSGNLSHITPNNSLGFVQATPSRVLPSPTVNTREALDVIMDMFQAPTRLDDPFNNTSVLNAAEREVEPAGPRNEGVLSFTKPPTSTPFTIFQDDKENGSSVAAPSAFEKSKPIRALAEIPVSNKPNDTPLDLMPDESAMWGARYNPMNSLAACPNSTTDFALLAQFVSTPFTCKTPSNFYQDQENNCDGADADDDAFIRRPPKKLSPIMEQSPSEEKLSETVVSQLAPSSERHGTIVGEGLATAPLSLTSSSSVTMVQPPPPAVLSFRDQTLCPTDSSAVPRTAAPAWQVYTSPEQPPKQASLMPQQPESPVRRRSERFTIMQDLDKSASPQRGQNHVYDVPMSPECALKPDWLAIRSPEVTVEPDLDAFLSPKKADAVPDKSLDVPMSPEQRRLCTDVPTSPMQLQHLSLVEDEPMMSPDRGTKPDADVSMHTTTPARSAARHLVSDPWDDELISDLLSKLTPPLTSHPRCITWQCNIPNISPKMTISMGKASLQVDCVLGEGAFATVYQATDPLTSEKTVLKVQKPANPWEFYINTQLDARLRPDVRHLYSSIRSAHIFHNGSVLLGELHKHGTLLNAVNIYKGLSEKVMPQPLVMYLTVCILSMVEQLHSINVIHADIKPDNFLLGDRFLEDKCFELENLDHGLVLIDLGQSIDMDFFPEGTAFTGRCLTSGFQCTEMLSGRPWNYQTDLFGVAGTVYCMLFGTYMQVTNEGGVWKTNGVFRRNPHSDLWQEFFHTLLNVPDCDSLPSLRSLRGKLTSVLQQNYSKKLPALKNRLVVLVLESSRAARR
ncbi:mitotic checkpoint serine/threonine-protein kinase BUB1 [Symphorus nematophorus]